MFGFISICGQHDQRRVLYRFKCCSIEIEERGQAWPSVPILVRDGAVNNIKEEWVVQSMDTLSEIPLLLQ